MRYVCPDCDGVGGFFMRVQRHYAFNQQRGYSTCAQCNGLGTVSPPDQAGGPADESNG